MFDCKRPGPHCSPVRASHRKVKAKVEVEFGHYRGGIDLWSTFSSVSTLLPQATNFPPLNLNLSLDLFSSLQFLDRVSGAPYDPYASAASLCLSLVGRDLSMNDSRSRPRLLLPQLILTREA